ncbi:MAG: hypothetical protein JXA19_05310 [Anaerolineales bacterium]|nr:hypothetical protein [Anaerolineales bacterium]
MSHMNENTLKRLVKLLAHTEDKEIDCEECYNRVDVFIEMCMFGEDPPEGVMPAVRHHLEVCDCCREEFVALVDALDGCESLKDLVKES